MTQYVRDNRVKQRRVKVTVLNPVTKRAKCLMIYGATTAEVVRHLRESAGRIGISEEKQSAAATGQASPDGNGTAIR